jgi:hypothetical protein
VGRLHRPLCQDAVCIHTGWSVSLCHIVHEHGLGQSWWKGHDPKTLFAIGAGWWSWYDAEQDVWRADEGEPRRQDSVPDTDRVRREAWWHPGEQRWVHQDDVPARFLVFGRARAAESQD